MSAQITFGRTQWHPPIREDEPPVSPVSLRQVKFDGILVGHVWGYDAPASNGFRPRAWIFRSVNRRTEIWESRLEDLRHMIWKAYTA